jgi:hypothetical protein
MTNREVISGFSTHLHKNNISTSFSHIPNRLAYHLAVTARDTIKHELAILSISKKDSIYLPNQVSDSVYLTFGCVNLKKADAVECECAPPSGCVYKRTIVPLPKLHENTTISVFSLDGYTKYDLIDSKLIKSYGNNPIAKNKLNNVFFIRTTNGLSNLYLIEDTQKTNISAVMVIAAPVDLIEALTYSNCNTDVKNCNYLDAEFISDPHIISLIYTKMTELLQRYQPFKIQDPINNDSND